MIATAVPFSMLAPARAYELWRLRQDVFVVEQECPYPDLDGRDLEPGTRHVLLIDGDVETGPLVGCARVLDDLLDDLVDGVVDGVPVWRIGRVALAPAVRGRGLADVVMQTALAVCRGRDAVLDAQAPLAGWYARLGFTVAGPEFVEDGIPHVPMRRPAG